MRLSAFPSSRSCSCRRPPTAGGARRGHRLRHALTRRERRSAGDRPLLATISPNGDGLRDRATSPSVSASRRASDLAISKTVIEPTLVYSGGDASLAPGFHTMCWAPTNVPPRTYLVRLSAVDRAGNRTTLGAAGLPRSSAAARRRP